MSKILTDQGFVEVGGELYHHGVMGMKWGVRRYQKKDGSRTATGKKHRMNLYDKLTTAAMNTNVKYYSSKADKYRKKANKNNVAAELNKQQIRKVKKKYR